LLIRISYGPCLLLVVCCRRHFHVEKPKYRLEQVLRGSDMRINTHWGKSLPFFLRLRLVGASDLFMSAGRCF
jgi:hypothetical protein